MSSTIRKEERADSVRPVKNKMYKVNPDSYASVFALPTQIADKHLRMAGKAQLKVLLWLYRNPAVHADNAVIAKDTGIPIDEIDDAMLYWIDAGLVLNEQTDEQPIQQTVTENNVSASEKVRAQIAKTENVSAEVPQNMAPPRKEKAKPVVVKPSIKDIAQRLAESDDIRSMFAEVQDAFGRTLGYDAQASLVILHDSYSLPAEVIIMLCNHAKTIGKQGSLAYIMKLGQSWFENNIDTFEKAAEKIEAMEKADKKWAEFAVATGLSNPKPTSKQAEYFEIWTCEYAFDTDMIVSAYERTVETKGKIHLGYMNGILRAWYEAGYKTQEDVVRADREFAGEAEKKRVTAKPQQKSEKHQSAASYDIEEALRRSRMLDPTKTKKGQ